MAGLGWMGIAGIGAAAATAAVAGWVVTTHDQAPVPAAPVAVVAPAETSAPKPKEPTAAPASAAPQPAKPAPAPMQQAAVEPPPVKPQSQAQGEPAQSPAAAAKPTPTAADLPPAPVKLPTFDIVRVEPSGDTVVAGQGVPGATVELLRDGTPFARAVADVGGQWAIVPKPLPKGAAELALRITTPDGRVALSQQVVTVRVPEQPGDQVVVVLNDPDAPAKVLNDGTQKPAQPKQAAQQVAQTPAQPTLAPAGTAAPAEPGQAAPPAAEAAKPARANVEIKTVEADEAGRFFVTGSAAPGADIRIYINETPLAGVKAAADGSFGMTIEKGMTPGSYRVRVDDVEAASGKVLTRAEVPFTMDAVVKPAAPPAVVTAQGEAAPKPATRDIAAPAPGATVRPVETAKVEAASKPAAASEKPAPAPAAPSPVSVAEAPAQTSVAVVPEIKTVTVARGDNLWRISRKSYGHGMRYTWIYDANTSQIRDPHWIYPGQIFVMPDKKEQAAQ